jgi:uncharacterized repeat protein (TIGR03943 family)
VRRETQNVLLVLLGGALLKLGLDGGYLRYVKPSQQPWVLAGGAVMLGLAVVAIVRDLRGRASPDPDGHHHAARSAWLLVLPVLAVFLVAPPALGSDSVNRTGTRAPDTQATASFPPLPPGDVVPLSMTDFVTRAGWDGTGSLNGRTVALTGFVTRQGGSVLLARMVIACCAADAFPMTVHLTGDAVTAYPDDTWLAVTGRVSPGTATRANNYTADFSVSTVRAVPAPRDPYES